MFFALIDRCFFELVIASVTEHFTSSPKPHTEAPLLSAMENAGKEDILKGTERRGLGAPATRVVTIEKLVSGGFVECKGKNLIPHKGGYQPGYGVAGTTDLSQTHGGLGAAVERGGKGPGVARGLHGRDRGDGGGAGAKILPHFRGWAKTVPAGEGNGGPLPTLRQAGL